MTTDPLFFAGLLLALVGATTAAIRPSDGAARLLLQGGGVLFVISGVLLIILVRDRHDFRVTMVQVVANPDYVGPCPGRKAIRTRVHTAGGSGDVVVQVLTEQQLRTGGRSGQSYTVPVRAGDAVELDLRVPVTGGDFNTAYVFVRAPSYLVGSTSYGVRCTSA